MMDLSTQKTNMENVFSQIQEKLTTARRQVADLELLEQRQIGALQLINVLIAEDDDGAPGVEDPGAIVEEVER